MSRLDQLGHPLLLPLIDQTNNLWAVLDAETSEVLYPEFEVVHADE